MWTPYIRGWGGGGGGGTKSLLITERYHDFQELPQFIIIVKLLSQYL